MFSIRVSCRPRGGHREWDLATRNGNLQEGFHPARAEISQGADEIPPHAREGSTRAVAERLGVSRRTVERYRAGKLTTPQKRLQTALVEETGSDW